MLKGTVTKIILTSGLVLCALHSGAQNTAYNAYTPYSMYGIGDISKQGTSCNKSMGGVGIATRDKRNINILNPAAVTEREEKSFMADIGIASGNRFYAQHDMKSSNNTFNMYNFSMSFPVYNSFAMYMGINPYSDVGYDISSVVTDPVIIAAAGNTVNSASGKGGLTNLYIGGGINVLRGLSVGGELQYYFGNITKRNSLEYSNTSFRSLYSGYNMHLKAATGKLGVQYRTPVSKDVTLTLGATYRLKASLKGKVEDYVYTSVSSVIDTTKNSSYTFSRREGPGLASEIGLGVSLKGGDKWTSEINYLRSDWTSSGMDKKVGFATVGNAVFSASASQSVRAGFSIVPNRNDVRYYIRTVTYRAGAYWDRACMKLDGQEINAFGLTFGMTLPVQKWSNGLTLGVDFGQRGSLAGNLIRERYINFNIGLNIFDIWFRKPRYE